MPKTDCSKSLALMTREEIKKVYEFHRSFPRYKETPLLNLACLAAYFGIKGIFIKDESFRFNLDAFKVLGGSYAIAKYIAGLDVDVIDVGVPVLSMHSPFEVVSKFDLYMAYRAFGVFFNEM